MEWKKEGKDYEQDKAGRTALKVPSRDRQPCPLSGEQGHTLEIPTD